MIRRGRREGWLSLSVDALPSFTRLHNINVSNIQTSGTSNRGNALIATKAVTSMQSPLVTVPSEVVLSRGNVLLHAKTDQRLREVLDACGDFASTSRHIILIFLLVQATYSCPDASDLKGVQHAFTNYIKFLPEELLPTFWTDEEVTLAIGTTLKPAHDAKMHSLYREYEELRRATSTVAWCRNLWWDGVDGILEFDDWKQVDAMYRSRALEVPGIGDAMLPYIDFANHASRDKTMAAYQTDENGNGLLLLYDGMSMDEGQEVTITYGDEKGACEMIFSYGFLEEDMKSANTLFLDLEIPDTDPLKRAKQAWDPCAPGVRLTVVDNEVSWESDYIWLIITNEEDGLEFAVLEMVTGERELRLNWNGEHVTGMQKLESGLHESPMAEVFQLRAIVLIEARIAAQLQALASKRAEPDSVRDQPRRLAERLRSLEGDLLETCANYFEQEKARLAATATVQEYLLSQQSGEDEDFS